MKKGKGRAPSISTVAEERSSALEVDLQPGAHPTAPAGWAVETPRTSGVRMEPIVPGGAGAHHPGEGQSAPDNQYLAIEPSGGDGGGSVKSGWRAASRYGPRTSVASSLDKERMKMPEPAGTFAPTTEPSSRPGTVHSQDFGAGPSGSGPSAMPEPYYPQPPIPPSNSALGRSLAAAYQTGASSAKPPKVPTNILPTIGELGLGTPRSDPSHVHHGTPHTHFGGVAGLMSHTLTFARAGDGGHVIVRRKPTLIESEGAALVTAEKALFGSHRPASSRIYWTLPYDHDERVHTLIQWIQQMSWALSELALDKFLSTKMRGALMTNADFRPWASPNEPAFDWISFPEAQKSHDRTLQESITSYDPLTTSLVFVFLVSESGNSVAVWRRKLSVPPSLQLRHAQDVDRIKAQMRKQPHIIKVRGDVPPQPPTTVVYDTTAKPKPRPPSEGSSVPPPPPKKKRWWKRMFRFGRKKKPDGVYYRYSRAQ